MASDSRAVPAGRGAHPKVRSPKLLEVLSALEDDEFGSNREKIFIAPPDNASGDFTDEDSGEEDSDQNGAQLPGRVLHASVVSEDSDPEEEEGKEGEDEGEKREEDKLELQLPKKKQKAAVETHRVWTKRDIQPDLGSWTASDPHMEDLKTQELSPVGLFELFFDGGTIGFIVDETNRYARQKNVTLDLTAQELKCVLGVLILSGYVSYPRRRMFWETAPDCHHHLVADAIRRDRFELIFSYLHFADNSDLDEGDRFAKVRPLLVRANRNFRKHAPLEEFYSFGQSVCEYFGPRGSRRRRSARPVRLGYKIWCGTTSRGYLVWFEPSQGGLDVGGSMVVRFVDALRERGRLPYHILFDKVFASVRLMSALRGKGVKATGTVREVRTGRCPLKVPREPRRRKGGSSHSKVEESSHRPGAAKARAQRHPPALLKLYREKARGLDRMDQNVAKYKVKIRGTRWYLGFLGYVLDAALHNAWQLHRLCRRGARADLLAFRRYVARVYLESNAAASSPGRRSRRPDTESRFDRIGHWIVHQDKRTRCALCHSQTNTRCEKCQKGVHAKCFREYHIP
ncbi:piggyBac transposable element-derived protein 2 [Psammomys obesus]|uniref:piggyBac transposable element-derived protein 2 n=1 Tax=Psammomys obesus TaxID=48139 RepID=UPI002452D116|nr:piggyBac transposable element-derived protein 2 [Psammomys obesus]XP_055458856.1 piggyBac transposable element-derived protein 2 [Psammomys obesus]